MKKNVLRNFFIINTIFLIEFIYSQNPQSNIPDPVPGDEFDPNHLIPVEKRRPSHYPEKPYCDTCIHMMGVAVNELAGKTKSMDVIDCVDKMFAREDMHKFFPDRVRLYAEHFISVWEEEVIKALETRKNERHAIYLACYEYSNVF